MQYKQPRLIKSVSLFLLFLVLCGAYATWRFFPPYWDAWTVDHHLQEAASSVYHMVGSGEISNKEGLVDLRDRTQASIVQAVGITDPNLRVSLNVDPGKFATFTADYDVVVTHPYISRTTKIHFHRVAQADLKQVKW